MTEVVISPKFQVVIPKEIRDKFPLQKGQKIAVLAKGDMIILMPRAPLKHYRGFLKGAAGTEPIREKKDRL